MKRSGLGRGLDVLLPQNDELFQTVVQEIAIGDIDPNTDANIWRGRARFAAGFNNWRCIALCGEGVSGTSVTA